MKTRFTLITALLLTSFMAANAQFSQGKYLLGGNINFSTANIKDSDLKNQTSNVSVTLGKFIKENTVVGINLNYGHAKVDIQVQGKQKTDSYGAGIFYRKYKSLSKDFHLFGEGGLNYAHSESNHMSDTDKMKVITNGVSINLMPGLSYSLTRKMQIELLMPNLVGIGYNQEKRSYTGSSQPNLSINKNSFSFITNGDGNLLSNFGVGFKFILGK